MSNSPPTDYESKLVPAAKISPRTSKIVGPILVLVGIEFWLIFGEGNYGHQHKPLLILLSIALAVIPPLNRLFNRGWTVIAHPSARSRALIALAICIISSLFLYWTQRLEKVPFKPKFEDEFSYLIQGHMLAQGHFWMPALPLPQYFQTFYLITTPVYASMYFPGAAIMYAPALLLHLPYYIAPLVVAGLCAAMLWLVVTAILDGGCGFLAVVLLLSLPMFRMMSIMVMAQLPTLLLGLVMTWTVLQWRKRQNPRWLALLSFAAGWAAITRPADALCFAIVLAIVMAMDLKAKPLSTWSRTFAIVAGFAIPFLLLQLWLNHNITGQWFTTPFARYNDINYPGAFGFHTGPAPGHVSDVPQIQLFYEINAKDVIERHQLRNFVSVGLKSQWEMMRRVAIADPFLWLIMPLSLPVMWNRRFWAVWGMLPVFLLGLSPYAFSWVLPHYMIMVMPAVILLAILPIQFLTATFPKSSGAFRMMISLMLISLALCAMPQFNRFVYDQYFEPPELSDIDKTLAKNASAPAVILFHFNRDALIHGKKVTNNPSEEPVFNAGVAWPDDAPIVRARDLNPDISTVGKAGDLDRPLYEYYSRVAPDRVFYLYNRGGGEDRLRHLGTASQLLAASTSTSQP
jgi:hypothetical protein